MGTLKNGIFGPVTGKIKNLVFYQLNGKDIVRSVGTHKNVVKSEALIARNKRFGLLSGFLSKSKPFIKAGFKNEAAGTVHSYYNIAMSSNSQNALNTVDGVPNIIFENVVLSRGQCLPALIPTVNLEEDGLRFTWSASDLPWLRTQDRVMMLAYFPGLNEALQDTDGAKRAEGSDLLKMPSGFITERMEIYIAFVAEDRESVSDSLYLGRIN